jgi:hypothetical protein
MTMSHLVKLLSIIESGEEGRFDQSVEPVLLPAPPVNHVFAIGCTCGNCESVWERRS